MAGACEHKITTDNGGRRVCTECFRVLPHFQGEDDGPSGLSLFDGVTKRREPKTIMRDLKSLDFPPEIKEKANEIFINCVDSKTYRSAKRKGIIFACIDRAYKDSGNPRSPEEIAKELKIKRKQTSSGVHLLSSVYTGQRPGAGHSAEGKESVESKESQLKPMHLVPGILQSIGLDSEEAKREIGQVYEKVKHLSTLKRAQPQSVAGGLVYYWAAGRISKDDFTKASGRSHVTTLKMRNAIAKEMDG